VLHPDRDDLLLLNKGYMRPMKNLPNDGLCLTGVW